MKTLCLDDAVLSAIDRRQDELVALLQALVRIPSESDAAGGNEGECQRFVMKKMRGLGLEIDSFQLKDVPSARQHPAWLELKQHYRGRPTVVGKWAGGDGPSLMLLAHIDTVPVGDLRQWTRDPWSGEIIDGKVCGRGACDDKNGTAAMLFAMEVLRELGLRPAGDLYLASTIHEESGYGNGLILLGERGYRPGGALYLDGRIGNASLSWHGAGDLFLDIRLAKSARRLVWAIHRRVEEIIHLLREERAAIFAANPHFAASNAAGRSISATPIIPRYFDRPRATPALRYRINISSVTGEVEAEIKPRVEEAFHDGLREFGAHLRFTYPSPWFEPVHYGADTAVARALIAAATAVNGRPPAVTSGTKSDGYIFFNHYGVPVANYGTGPFGEGGAHGPNEALPIPSLVELAKVAALTVLCWQGS
ncbi:MAG: M20 family metallopeptidase [Armatimonadota bacterium]